MPTLGPAARSPLETPLALGTAVQLDRHVTFYDRELIAGGAPWRLLRLSSASSQLVHDWRQGGVVTAGQGPFARTLVQRGLLHPTYRGDVDLNDVDVVVPVFGSADALARLLNSLRGMSVIVVDDGSPNERQIAEVAGRFDVRLIRRPRNDGPAAARNTGALRSEKPYVWFLDVDVVTDNARSVAMDLLTHFQDPLVAAVAPRVRGASDLGVRSGFESRHGALDMGPSSGLVVPRSRVGYVPSACLLVRREAMGDGFDEEMRVGEDVDLVWRLHDRGWLVRYDAGVSVHHDARSSWQAWLRQRHNYGRSAGALAQRHPERLAPVRVDAWTLAAWAALVARRPRMATAITAVARRSLEEQLPKTVADPGAVANAIAVRGIAAAGGPLARNIVRTYGPVVVAAALHPKLRRPALAVFAAGTAWRWKDHREFSLTDVPLAVADDVAYATGVWRGAWTARSLRAVTPAITGSTAGLRAAVASRLPKKN